ncbi:MAG: hypothetical protein ACRC5W_04655 [Cetobacterium sp.]
MINTRKGSTYIETLISLVIILFLLNPLFGSLIYIKREFNKFNSFIEMENEMEKIRAFYRKNENEYVSSNEKLKISIKKYKVYEEVYSLEITVQKNEIKRESILYVYKQK